MIGIGIAFLVALALMATSSGAKAKPGGPVPPPNLPPVVPGPPDVTKPTVATTGKSGTQWLTQEAGRSASSGYLYVDVFLPAGQMGAKVTSRVLRYAQPPGSGPRSLTEVAPGVSPSVVEMAMLDFNLPVTSVGPINVADMSAALQQELADAMTALTVTMDGKVVGPVTAEAIQKATAVAGELDRAGFGAAATALRAFITMAAKLVPGPTPDKTVPLPSTMPPDLQAQVNRALQLERDPAKLTAILNALKAYQPQTPDLLAAIGMLQALIVQVQTAQSAKDALNQISNVVNPPAQSVPSTVQPPGDAVAPHPTLATYIVQKGDSPYAIAQRFTGSGARYKELDAVNPTHSPKPSVSVWTGEQLLLPASWPAHPATPGVTPPAQAIPSGHTYTVMAGDSPYGIAAKFTGSGSRYHELDAVNPTHSPKPSVSVWTGELLNLPASWPAAPGAAPPQQAIPVPSSGHTYTVLHGDSAYAIAAKFTGSGSRYVELDAVNTQHSPKPSVSVWTGEVLNLPSSWPSAPSAAAPPPPQQAIPQPSAAPAPAPYVAPAPAAAPATTYVVQRGDSPYGIAQKLSGNGNRYKELDAVNTQHSPKPSVSVWTGEVLNIPPSWTAAVHGLPEHPLSIPSVPQPGAAPRPKAPVEIAADAMVRNLKAIQGAYPFPTAHGKEDQGIVRRFQHGAHSPENGMASPEVIVLAAINGQSDLPLVHYWPRNATGETLEKYRATLRTIASRARAAGDHMGADLLEMSAARECGQGSASGAL